MSTSNEQDVWEAILTGWNLGMARGINRLLTGGDVLQKLGDAGLKVTKYDPTESTVLTPKQALVITNKRNRKRPELRKQSSKRMKELNKEQWADPMFRARRSVECSRAQTERWNDPEYKAKMLLAQANGRAKKGPRMADCCPDKPHEAKGLCTKHYRQQNYQETKVRLLSKVLKVLKNKDTTK